MKNSVKLFVSIIAIGMIALTSCKKGKNDLSNKARLVGKWKMVKVATDANNNNVIDASELVTAPDSVKASFTFNSDETGDLSTDIIGFSLSFPFTWSLTNNDQDLKIKISSGSIPLPTDASTVHIEVLTYTDLITKDTTTVAGVLTNSWTIFQKQ